jgi:hypothetical protein
MKKPIGLHVHSRRADDQVRRYIIEVKPSVMKWLDGGVNPELVKLANASGALTILRVYEPNQSLDPGKAKAYLKRVDEALKRWPEFQAVEGFNESFQRLPDVAARADFDIKLMKLAERRGKKAVIGSFSVGQPQWPETGHADDWAGYLPALRYAGERDHFVGLHEYGAPAMQWGCGANQLGALDHGRWHAIDRCERPGVEGWFVLRYRRAIRHWKALGLGPLPRIVIAESGLDDVQPRPNVGRRRGYKTYGGTEWAQHPILGDFADGLAWTCRRWSEDELVVGGCDFGFADVSGDWDDFDLSTDLLMFDRVVREMTLLPDSAPAPAPRPEPDEVVEIDGQRYVAHVFQKGDRLWSLAGHRWPEIQRSVPMFDPHNIPVGTVVMIPEDIK